MFTMSFQLLVCIIISSLQHVVTFSNRPSLKGTVIIRSDSKSYLKNPDINSKTSSSLVEDDGWSTRFGRRKGAFRSVKSVFKRVFKGKTQPGTLILIRNGESAWNFNSTFTGWVDIDLSERGVREMEHAGRLLLERGYRIDVMYTSRLKRAIRSTWIILQELNQVYRPVYKSFRLNERMYGALEGLSKPQLAATTGFGKEQVQAYRTALDARPPPMSSDHPLWHGNERKYADLEPSDIPDTESLTDTMDRTLPLWNSRIKPELESGNNVMVVAHGHSLRGLVRHIDNLTSEQIQLVGIPNGIPMVYKFDLDMKPIVQNNSELPLSGEYLEKKGLLRSALAHQAELAKNISGFDLFDPDMSENEKNKRYSPPLNPFLTGLVKLEKDKKLLQSLEDGGSTLVREDTKEALKPSYRHLMKNIKSVESKSKGSDQNGPYLVIIRHGKTEHNKLGLFTGWEDAPLAAEGKIEARDAGRLLKAHGIEFDVVYTSWLSRAIETAWMVLDELDLLWLPIFKTWRLNERMYGSLTGLSKLMIGQKHGAEQLKLWRRSYSTRPPSVSSFSSKYPGNDERYMKNVRDIRVSIFESLIRSISHFNIEMHRKFPKTESLKDCMERTIPYYLGTIYPESIAKNKNVLIASSENAIRGLLMHLCEIPTDRISEVEIPTGLPLIFDLKRKCVKLLDDGEGTSPLGRYNFGTSPDLLFKPCDLDNEDLEIGNIIQNDNDQCYIDDNGNLYAYDPIIRLPTHDDDDDDDTHFLHSGTDINDFDSADSDMHSGGGNF